jgi:hypothetical protein
VHTSQHLSPQPPEIILGVFSAVSVCVLSVRHESLKLFYLSSAIVGSECAVCVCAIYIYVWGECEGKAAFCRLNVLLVHLLIM